MLHMDTYGYYKPVYSIYIIYNYIVIHEYNSGNTGNAGNHDLFISSFEGCHGQPWPQMNNRQGGLMTGCPACPEATEEIEASNTVANQVKDGDS